MGSADPTGCALGAEFGETRPIHEFMRRIAPPHQQAQCAGEIKPIGAVMCSIMVMNSVIERNGNRILEEYGLTLPQWLALGCISHAGDEGIPHSQLGQRLMLSKGSITGIVDRLERAGLVERQADAKDRRVSRAVATPEGVEMWWRCRDGLQDYTHPIVGDCLEAEEQEQLLTLLGKLLGAFVGHDPVLSELQKAAAKAESDDHPAEKAGAPQEAPLL